MATFTIDAKFGKKTMEYQIWDGQRLRSYRERPLALDTETTMIDDERKVPRLALAAASDGKQNVIIHPDRLAEFLVLHSDAYFVGHNVAFDFWVINQHFELNEDERTRRILWDACNRGHLFDTQILDMLLQLATGRFRSVGDSGANRDADNLKIYPGNLADVAADYTGLRITKNDSHRTRFAELLDVGKQGWDQLDPGFFEYAARDALVTRRLYPALASAAYKIMLDFGLDRKATHYDILPDAVEKFGYLSETIQVKASIVLASMFRRGVRVDVAKARALEAKYRAELTAITGALEKEYPNVLTRDEKIGSLKLTPKGQTPSLGNAKLKAMLVQVVDDIRRQGNTITLPLSAGKKRDVSRRLVDWSPFAGLHPFLGYWTEMAKLSKRLAFLSKINAAVVHGQYSLLTRTGRTSCSAPRSMNLPGLNLQNIPRESEFRELFVARPGSRLFIGDFAAAELRTLAAVCEAKFGSSRLGDVIRRGADPHAFTAAFLLGINPEDFMALKENDPTRFRKSRQAAKALNFGIPGGLGAERLMDYAKTKYGVTLTTTEAQEFKATLINRIYPELNDHDGYLADESMAILASNLGVTEQEAWESFSRDGKPNSLAARGVSNVVRGVSTATEEYQLFVWGGLKNLMRMSSGQDDGMAEAISLGHGGRELHERLYRQSVATLTGRIRAGVGFTDGKNTPFQSLAADGAKLALWNLLYAGFSPYAFIHDETIVELDANSAEQDARTIVDIKVRSMEEVMGHGIPAACDWVLADCWTKP